MSDINANIVVSPIDLNVSVNTNQLSFTPDAISLNMYAGGMSTIANGLVANIDNVHIYGGSANYALFTDGSGNLTWASVANATNANYANYAGNVTLSAQSNITSLGILTGLRTTGLANFVGASNVALGAVGNVHITGGVNGYVLQTDGTGNLAWTAQTGGGGNGSPGGADTQVQYNNGGLFGGSAGFTFNSTNGNLNVPGNIIGGNSITANYTNAVLTTNAQPNITSIGTLTSLNVSGVSNLNSNSNVYITGGNSGQVLTTDGSGNLSWSTPAGATWTNVANIQLNDLFFGTYGGSNTTIQPGNTVTFTSVLNANSFVIANAGYANGVFQLANTTNYIWAQLGGTAQANIIRADTLGTTWTKVSIPFTGPTRGPLQAGNNIVIWKTGSNSSAYSTNDGSSWTVANNINTTLNLGSGAYGNGTIIIIRSEALSNNYIKSTDYGVTWSNSNVGVATLNSKAIAYGNGKFISTYYGSSTAKRTTDNGSTWSNITMPTTYAGNQWNGIAYGNGKWVAITEYNDSTHRATSAVSSDDGNTWTQTLLANLSWQNIVYSSAGYFIASEIYGNVITSADGITWTTANTNLTYGGSIAFNSKNNLLVTSSVNGDVNVAAATTTKISVTSADGNLSNGQPVPLGTYKNLGGAVGNVGAMWIRTA